MKIMKYWICDVYCYAAYLTSGASSSASTTTKILYYTNRSATPFMSSVPKQIGDVTLRDFKNLFDRPGFFRFHFKSVDQEFGMVKEEVRIKVLRLSIASCDYLSTVIVWYHPVGSFTDHRRRYHPARNRRKNCRLGRWGLKDAEAAWRSTVIFSDYKDLNRSVPYLWEERNLTHSLSRETCVWIINSKNHLAIERIYYIVDHAPRSLLDMHLLTPLHSSALHELGMTSWTFSVLYMAATNP